MSNYSDLCVKYAVLVERLNFGYTKRNAVLNNLSIQIEQGKIFALLGSNGCGKTTLLKLILGRAIPKSGVIEVFGQKPGYKYSSIPGPTVGYMPQEIALFPEFTIEENLRYFAKLFHLTSEEFEETFEYLTQLLNLSQKNRRIDELSGGQQRLVSVAATILHRPKLIILDEPTVGVDPILRTRIWSYLEDICHQNGNTVIITTHYIEEAKRASNVGFMKSGAILRQSNPQKLLCEYQCPTLEAVYFHLWELNDYKIRDKIFSEVKTGSKLTPEICFKVNSKLIDPFYTEPFVDVSRVLSLIWAFNLRLRKLPILLLCYIAIPFLSLFSLYLSVGHLPHDIPAAIYSEESDPLLSKQFIDSIDGKFLDVIQYESKDLAIDSIFKGKNAFAIFFDKSFTERIQSRLLRPFEMSSQEQNSSLIKLYADTSRAVVLVYAFQYMAELSQQFLTNVSISLGLNSKAFTLPFTIEQPIYGVHPITGEQSEKFKVNYHYLLPAFLLVTFHITSMILSALSIVIYRRDGQLERYFMSGGQPIEFIIAHYTSKTIYISIQVFFLLICSSFLFDIKQEGSYLEVYLICFLQSLQGVSIGLLIAIPFKQELTIGTITVIVMAPMYFTSGVFWPLEGIPLNYRLFADWTPLSKPIDCLRSIMLRGWDYSHPNVFIGYVVSIAYTLIIFIFNVIIFQISQEPFF